MVDKLFRIPDETPLMGAVSFGLIDRGTNIIQVRPSSSCPLNCIFCSTDAGPCSKRRRTEYEVGMEHLMDWLQPLAELKGKEVEAHIDTVGDPFSYRRLVDLVSAISDVEQVGTISLQTHGYLMTEHMLDELSEAGLDRINLSLDSTDPYLAKKLSGTESYDVEKVIAQARHALENTGMDILLAPVWVHPLNDSEMEPLVSLAEKIGAGRRGPPLGIQKCEFHRFGRRTKEMRQQSWYNFYKNLRTLEAKTGAKLLLRPSDFGIHSARSVEPAFAKNEVVNVRVIGPGWFKGESLAVTKDGRWSVTLVGEDRAEELRDGQEVAVRLLRTRDNVLVGRPR